MGPGAVRDRGAPAAKPSAPGVLCPSVMAQDKRQWRPAPPSHHRHPPAPGTERPGGSPRSCPPPRPVPLGLRTALLCPPLRLTLAGPALPASPAPGQTAPSAGRPRARCPAALLPPTPLPPTPPRGAGGGAGDGGSFSLAGVSAGSLRRAQSQPRATGLRCTLIGSCPGPPVPARSGIARARRPLSSRWAPGGRGAGLGRGAGAPRTAASSSRGHCGVPGGRVDSEAWSNSGFRTSISPVCGDAR